MMRSLPSQLEHVDTKRLYPWKYRRKYTRHRVVVLLISILVCSVDCSSVYTYQPRPQNTFRASEDCPVEPPCFCAANEQRHSWHIARRITCSYVTSGQTFPRFRRHVPDGIPNHVTLMYAGLRTIPSNAFHNLRVVDELDLQGNDFQDSIDPRAFSGVAKDLQALNLAWSNVTSIIPRVLRGMVDLKNLSLAENKINKLSSFVFQDLRSLERLSLAGNPMTQLPGDIFRFLTNLEMLDLGYCQLERLPWNLFIGLWNMKHLDIRGNRLQQLDSYTFMDLYSLHTLLLSHNPIWRLQSRVFYGLRHLTVLRSEESRLQYIAHDVFHDTRSLRVLDLGDNRIITLPPGALLIPGLEQLSLDGNGLKYVPRDVAFVKTLKSLDLSYNNIEQLDNCIFEGLSRLEYVNLRENPFTCDCSLFWLRKLQRILMLKWTDQTQPLPFVPGHCRHPKRLRGVGITRWLDLECFHGNLHSGQLKCQDVSYQGNNIDARKQRNAGGGGRRSRHLRRYLYYPIG